VSPVPLARCLLQLALLCATLSLSLLQGLLIALRRDLEDLAIGVVGIIRPATTRPAAIRETHNYPDPILHTASFVELGRSYVPPVLCHGTTLRPNRLLARQTISKQA